MITKLGLQTFIGPVILSAIIGSPTRVSSDSAQKIGSFQWDRTSGEVLVQQASDDRLLVQVRIQTASQTSAGSWKTRPLPTGAMEAWVLLEGGRTLEQTPRQPPKGATAIGVGNAGSEYSFVTFGFTSRPDDKIAAVVVKVETEFHVFPTQGFKS